MTHAFPAAPRAFPAGSLYVEATPLQTHDTRTHTLTHRARSAHRAHGKPLTLTVHEHARKSAQGASRPVPDAAGRSHTTLKYTNECTWHYTHNTELSQTDCHEPRLSSGRLCPVGTHAPHHTAAHTRTHKKLTAATPSARWVCTRPLPDHGGWSAAQTSHAHAPRDTLLVLPPLRRRAKLVPCLHKQSIVVRRIALLVLSGP